METGLLEGISPLYATSAQTSRTSTTAVQPGTGTSTTDRVTISEQARALAAAMQEKKATTSGTSTSEGSSVGNLTENAEQKIEKLRKRIKELQTQIVQIEQSPLPDGQKQTTVAPLRQQVQQIEQQIQQLMVQAMKSNKS